MCLFFNHFWLLLVVLCRSRGQHPFLRGVVLGSCPLWNWQWEQHRSMSPCDPRKQLDDQNLGFETKQLQNVDAYAHPFICMCLDMSLDMCRCLLIYIYILGCCSNTFLAGLFRRLFAVVFVILHCLVFCYFCVRVLLFLRSCSVILAFVFCYFCVRVLLFLRSCSVIFVFVFCYFCVTEQMWTFYRTNVEILQNKCGHFTEHMWKIYRTNVEILQNKMWKFYRTNVDFYRTNVEFLQNKWGFLQNKCGIFTEQMWNPYRTNVLLAFKIHICSVKFCRTNVDFAS